MLLTICTEAFHPVIENAILEYGLPLPKEVPSLDLKTPDVLGLVLLPWDDMVRTTFSMALQIFQITPKWGHTSIEILLTSLLPSEDQCYLDQFAHILVEVVHGHQHLLDVFAGHAPFTNAPLKKLASAGSFHVYTQIGTLLKAQTTTKKSRVAANDSLVEIYDAFFQLRSTLRNVLTSDCILTPAFLFPSLQSPRGCTHCTGAQDAPSFVPLSDEVKYLGVFLDVSSNNRRNISYRIAQAASASRLLTSPVHRSVAQSILLYAMESAQLTPPQLTRIDHVWR